MASKNDIKVMRDGDTRYFDKATWAALPPNKYGWKPVVEMPEEVIALKNNLSAGNNGQLASGTGKPVQATDQTGDFTAIVTEPGINEPPVTEPVKRDLVVNVVKKIEAATSIDEVNALCPEEEDRVTIITAANHKIEQLQKLSQ